LWRNYAKNGGNNGGIGFGGIAQKMAEIMADKTHVG
jgi:hypothetical protein